MKQIIITALFLADGSLDTESMDREYFQLRDKLKASVQEDFDTVSVAIFSFLLENPALKTIPTSSLVRALWERKVEAGELKGKSQEERGALHSRLEEVVPEYVKSNPDLFHMGRKTGIAISHVPGEYLTDKDGNQLQDKDGNPVQAYRTSPEEWAKLTAKKEKENGTAASTVVSA